jgi:hypothetical protein
VGRVNVHHAWADFGVHSLNHSTDRLRRRVIAGRIPEGRPEPRNRRVSEPMIRRRRRRLGGGPAGPGGERIPQGVRGGPGRGGVPRDVPGCHEVRPGRDRRRLRPRGKPWRGALKIRGRHEPTMHPTYTESAGTALSTFSIQNVDIALS